MIFFNADTELEVIDSFNEKTDNIDECHNEVFLANERYDAEIVDEDGDYVSLQFGDGSLITGVFRDCFTVIS